MFDQIDLITVKQIKNKNGEKIDQEERFTVAVTNETVSRSARSEYNPRGLGRSLRFKILLYGPAYFENVVYFEHMGHRYYVQDFVKDKTGTGYYIEGTSNK